MKKRIVIGLSIFSLIFLLGGIYIIFTIEKTTSSLDKLITLHQVEILREHLLIHIKRVQSDINLKNTRYARGIDVIISDFQNMEKTAQSCFDCHHNERVLERLSDLKNHIEDYKNAISRVLTIRANNERLEAEEDNAFKIGEELISKVNNMIALTSSKLEIKTNLALADIGRAKILLFMLVAVGHLLAIALAFIFIKSFTRPVDLLHNATKQLKAGNLDFRINGLKDEFGEVAASFNEMAASLKEHVSKMQRTEQLKLCGEMAAGLAHEIKNPLAGIKVTMEVLSEDLKLSDEDKDLFMQVIDEIKRIELLIRELLDFAKPPRPQFLSLDINDILESSISLLKNNQIFNEIDIIHDFSDSIPHTMADPMHLKQVFINLFMNAGEAMQGKGIITIKTAYEKSSNSISVTINDTGRGINLNILDKIFEPFFTTKSKGTGLGLSITKRLIEQHGGSINARNNKNGGATFIVMFPVNQSGDIQA